LRTQFELIEVLKVSIDQADGRKVLLKDDYERQKAKMQEELKEKVRKREGVEREVEALRKELERLNNMRNNLYAVLGNEERTLKDKENEKNRLIVQKSAKLQDLAEKEK
jgi:septal ring factor EnvC (AmiA/AmiB activator)